MTIRAYKFSAVLMMGVAITLGLFFSVKAQTRDPYATVTSVSANGTTVDISFQTGGSIPITSAAMIFGTDQNSLNERVQAQSAPALGFFSARVGSLNAGATYYYQLVSDDGYDHVLTDVLTFRAGTSTGAGGTGSGSATSVTITNTEVYDISILIEGRLNSPGLTVIDVLYGENPNFPGYRQQANINQDGTFSVELTGLKPLTRYYYQVRDLIGKQMLSARAITTKSSVYEINISDITQTTATVSGTVRTQNAQIRILCGIFEDEDTSCTFTPSIQSDLTFKEELTNLSSDTVYGVAVVNTQGSRLSGLRAFRTKGLRVTPYVKVDSETQATITASASNGVQSLTVLYGKDQADLDQKASMTSSGQGEYRAVLTGLEPNTNYTYSIEIVSTENSATTYTTKRGFFTRAGSTGIGTVTGGVSTPTIIQGDGVTGKTRTFSGGLVPCTGVDEEGRFTCTFADVIKLITNVIDFLLFIIAPVIAAFMFLYAGFLILTSAGSTDKVSKAKEIFLTTLVGIVVALAAWIIVKSILVGVGYNTQIFPSFF